MNVCISRISGIFQEFLGVFRNFHEYLVVLGILQEFQKV
jgi:hypothetical protein